MKTSTLFRLVVVITFLCLLTVSAMAQAIVSGYTSIDYDESTNTVIAYSETDMDYSLVGEYRAYVNLTVTRSSGGTAAYGSANDTHGNGFASLFLEFAGVADTTYTAVGRHRVYLELWDYYPTFPYEQFFYDNWYFSNFEGQTINEPLSYDFISPGNFYFRRRNEIVPLGSTYDSVSTQTFNFRGSIQAQGPDISYGQKVVDLGDGVKANGNTISWKWAQTTALTAQQGINALNLVKGKLGASQRNKRTAAFTAAESYITTCKNAGGCDSNFPGRAFQGTDGAHVDVVIAKGVNFKN